jgi:hypothetical protein
MNKYFFITSEDGISQCSNGQVHGIWRKKQILFKPYMYIGNGFKIDPNDLILNVACKQDGIEAERLIKMNPLLLIKDEMAEHININHKPKEILYKSWGRVLFQFIYKTFQTALSKKFVLAGFFKQRGK